jgi:hypothetical protein
MQIEMRRPSTPLYQVLVMAAVVATLMGGPVVFLLALFALAVLGISFNAFLTFGGELNAFLGLLAWWGLAFLASLLYSGYMLFLQD